MPSQHKLVLLVCQNENCRQGFMARECDVKAGKGHFCSLGCGNAFRAKKPRSHPVVARSHPSGPVPATQKGKVRWLLENKEVVYNRDFDRLGIGYIARNRVSELRRDGYVIAHKGAWTGRDWLKNAYRKVCGPEDEPDQALMASLERDGWSVLSRRDDV